MEGCGFGVVVINNRSLSDAVLILWMKIKDQIALAHFAEIFILEIL